VGYHTFSLNVFVFQKVWFTFLQWLDVSNVLSNDTITYVPQFLGYKLVFWNQKTAFS